MDEPSAIVSFLREFGFPIFVCVWFMWRLEKKMDKLTDRVHKLITVNTVLVKALDEPEDK